MSHYPRISFGMIVLNGEPFIRYNLRQIYPYAYQIIIVEGAVRAAANIATPDGHSRDNTLQIIRDFIAREDHDDKISLITQDGFWDEKDQMSQAYANHASGDYLFQVDVDEFYEAGALETLLSYLQQHPEVTGATFRSRTFWGSPNCIVDSWLLRHRARNFHRLFKWGGNYQYLTHRPPTVINEQGDDVRTLNWLDAEQTYKLGIILYHYSLLLPKQVQEKVDYYHSASWLSDKEMLDWAKENYFALRDPFKVHNVRLTPSWLKSYDGRHPEQATLMWHDIQQADITLRDMSDVDRLLSMRCYAFLCSLLIVLSNIYSQSGVRKKICMSIYYRIIQPVGQKMLSRNTIDSGDN